MDDIELVLRVRLMVSLLYFVLPTIRMIYRNRIEIAELPAKVHKAVVRIVLVGNEVIRVNLIAAATNDHGAVLIGEVVYFTTDLSYVVDLKIEDYDIEEELQRMVVTTIKMRMTS